MNRTLVRRLGDIRATQHERIDYCLQQVSLSLKDWMRGAIQAIDSQSQRKMRQEINSRIETDYELLRQLREEIRPLRDSVRRIQPRTTTSISLVGTDGGNNRIQFDPFLVQLVRVVDSSNNEYCLEAVTPTTDVVRISAQTSSTSTAVRYPRWADDGIPGRGISLGAQPYDPAQR